ncbi:unnamed protein product [Paramecium octaurelia]|uniref:Uncharacterized protein n=1 Tax=Paramecium octaurelia TaxID=43137 RepID=A0A8S1VC78_PAROT|nr:unnamed protein product [Paramecium octaurelia]
MMELFDDTKFQVLKAHELRLLTKPSLTITNLISTLFDKIKSEISEQSVMNMETPETIKVSKTNSSNSNRFCLITEKIDFNDPKPLIRFKTLLAHQIIQK